MINYENYFAGHDMNFVGSNLNFFLQQHSNNGAVQLQDSSKTCESLLTVLKKDNHDLNIWFKKQTINPKFVRRLFSYNVYFDLDRLNILLDLFKPYKTTFELAIRDTWIKPLESTESLPINFIEPFLTAKLLTLEYVEQHFPWETLIEQASSFTFKEILRHAMLFGALGGIYTNADLRKAMRKKTKSTAYDELIIKHYREGTNLFLLRRFQCGKPKKMCESIWSLIMDFLPYSLISDDSDGMVLCS